MNTCTTRGDAKAEVNTQASLLPDVVMLARRRIFLPRSTLRDLPRAALRRRAVLRRRLLPRVLLAALPCVSCPVGLLMCLQPRLLVIVVRCPWSLSPLRFVQTFKFNIDCDIAEKTCPVNVSLLDFTDHAKYLIYCLFVFLVKKLPVNTPTPTVHTVPRCIPNTIGMIASKFLI